MKNCRNIAPLEITPPSWKVPPSGSAPESSPASITAFVPPKATEQVYRLVDAEELARVALDRLTIKLNPSVLCQLRAKGLPCIRFSARRIRYNLTECLEWLILSSIRGGHNPKLDPFKLLNNFGLGSTPDGVA